LFEKTIWAALLPLIYLFFHITTWRNMVTIGHGAQLVGVLGQTARNVFIFGTLLSLGLLI
jgi:1,4-dihydroxy-2-naphthoate octaprenyltransferase